VSFDSSFTRAHGLVQQWEAFEISGYQRGLLPLGWGIYYEEF